MIGDFVLVFVVVGGGLLALFLQSTRKDRADAKRKEARAREEAAAAREEARKYEAGVRLVCLGCGKHFEGPLTEMGCPDCRLSSLVLTEAQFAQQQAK